MVDRSILNKTNSTFKHNTDNHIHPSTTPSVDDAVLSHFRVDASPMSSPSGAKGSPVETRDSSSSTPQLRADEYHDHNRLLAMAEVIPDSSYTQQPSSYYGHHATEVSTRSYHHHLLTPSTSPQDYKSPGYILSPPNAQTPAATPAGGYAEDDEYATEIEPDQEIQDHGRDPIPNTSGALVPFNRQPKGDGKFVPICQYVPNCQMNRDPSNAFCRKTVSHIFGRNKTSTQLIPNELWIWYCRKHYQRQRYRVDNWAETQVDIVLMTLDRFEAWGNIQSFSVTLRKREQDRNRGSNDIENVNTPASRRRTSGRISATRAQEILYKARVTAAGGRAVTDNSDPSASQDVQVTSTGRRKSFPVNVASPVPRFLYPYLRDGQSFQDVRHIMEEIKSYIKREQDQNNKEVSFPDIEILPVFTAEFLRSQGRTTDQLSEGNHSRRRRARNVRLGRYNNSSRVFSGGHLERHIQYPPSFPIPHHLPDPLPHANLHPLHNALPAPIEPHHGVVYAHSHAHYPALPPPLHMQLPYPEFRQG